MSVTIKTIKQKILDQAMRGELVEQDPNDEPVELLLERIEKEKNKLIEDNKIRKQKPLSTINEEDIPYEIPKEWRWSRLGSLILSLRGGGTPSKSNPDYWDGDIPWCSVKDMDEGIFLTSTQDKITPLGIKESSTFVVPKNNLIVATRMGLGKVKITHFETAINQDLKAIFTPESIDNKYLYYSLKQLEFEGKGSTVKGITQDELLNSHIPLPPNQEQKRIVEKIESLFSLCDKWEEEVTKQQNHLSVLRDKVLEDAMRGLLVEQDENDEPAEKLLEKVEEEREQLIKEKKIKKQKVLPPIEEDEVPYELPKGWKWVKLENISTKIHYGYTASSTEQDTGVRMVRITDIQNGRVIWENVPFCEIKPDEIDKFSLAEKDILIARTGGTVGKSFKVSHVPDTAVFASYLIRVQIFESVYSDYVKYFLESEDYWTQLEKKKKGTGQPNVNAKGLSNLLIPLPPLSEQKRIVEKIESVYEHIEQLEKHMILPK